MADRYQNNELGSYWDRVASGELDVVPIDVEPDLAGAILWAMSQDDSPSARAGFVSELGARLFLTKIEAPSIPSRLNGSNSTTLHSHDLTRLDGSRCTAVIPFWRRATAQLAFVAILITLLLGVAVLTQLNDDDRNEDSVGTDASVYRGGPERSGTSPDPGPKSTPSLLWRFQLEHAPANAVAVANGTVYIGDDPLVRMESEEPLGALHAVDQVTGRERWSFATAGGVSVAPAVVDGVVYVSDNSGTLSALDAATGTVRWQLTVGDAFGYPSSPVVVEGVVYLQWTGAGGQYRSPAIANGLVVLAAGPFNFSASTTLVAIDAVTGSVVWSRDDFQGDDSGYYAVEASTGSVRWRFATGSISDVTPAIEGDTAYLVGGSDGRLYAVNLATGIERWVANIGGEFLSSTAPAVTKERLYLLSRNSEGSSVVALATTSGAELWRSPLDQSAVGAPVVAGDAVYAFAVGGRLFALSGADGAPLWTYDLPRATDEPWTEADTHLPLPTIADGNIFVCLTSPDTDGTNRSSLFAVGKP